MDWQNFSKTIQAVAAEVAGPLQTPITTAAAQMIQTLRQGGKILACGNGGSAADAQHFAAELVNRFLLERRPYAAIALTTDTSTLTSIANDYNYARVFARQVEALGNKNDLLLAISTSGNAQNVLAAATTARAAGIHVVALTGKNGGKLAPLAHTLICISASNLTARIQEGHAMVIHALCELIEETLAHNPTP